MAQLYERNQVGQREDLADYIANVDARNTPLLSRVKVGKALTRKIADWQVDGYPEVNTAGVLDGADATDFENFDARAMVHGVAQKFWRLPRVSDFAENVADVAGLRTKEMAEQVRKALVMIKRDMEARFCAAELEAQVDNGTVANETRSLGRWLQSTAQAVYPVPTDFRTPASSIDTTPTGELTEDDVKAVMKSIYNQRGIASDYWCPVGADLKERISTFASYSPAAGDQPLREFSASQDSKKLTQMVDVLLNDFGTLNLVLSNFIAKDTDYSALRGFILDMDMVELRYARKPRVKPLEDKGGGPRAIVDAIAMLVVKNPLGHGKLAASASVSDPGGG